MENAFEVLKFNSDGIVKLNRQWTHSKPGGGGDTHTGHQVGSGNLGYLVRLDRTRQRSKAGAVEHLKL